MRGISNRARAYLQSHAQAEMTYSCRIERLVPATFDESNSLYTAGTHTTIYLGKCRVWQVAGGGAVYVNEEQVVVAQTKISIPWNNIGPKRNDEVVITAAPLDEALLNKRFRILDADKGGDLRATRQFTVSLITEES